MNILISNDDGINAEGIKILAQEISKIANTYVVAPDSPRSASGHAITLHKPILINDEFIAENVEAYSTSGTPADCVKVGIESILKDIEIDLVKWNKQWTKFRNRCYIFWNSCGCD